MPNPSLDFYFAYEPPTIQSVFRECPEDFVVEELFEQPLTGEGEHFWLKIKKRGENTDWIAKKLSNYFAVRTMDVGYAGKKDRHAVTTQWFSVYLPKQDHRIDWHDFSVMAKVDAELLETSSHKSKLKKGEHKANTFCIRLRALSNLDGLEQRLSSIQERGVPNYYGQQRFGRDGGNISKAQQWVEDPRSIRNKSLRGIIISSARSFLFNTVLSQRVNDGTWCDAIEGDPGESVSTGPLWGRGLPKSTHALLSLETELLEDYSSWCAALENVGLQQERRNLVLRPRDFCWELEESDLTINMTLNPGEYATSILREISLLTEPSFREHEPKADRKED